MDASSPAPVTESEWFVVIAEMSSKYGPEPLIAMLGSVTSDLTDEARGSAVAIAKTYATNQASLRRYPPLTLADSPLAAE